MLDKYKHKIKTADEIATLIGDRPRQNKVVMCQGCFDLVHPGHIRHMVYAKQHADILIVGVTADMFIKKGAYRPHVPEALRALNLAALEIVDYVVIQNAPRPDDDIIKLKPDFYAKGFEYQPTQREGKHITEEELVSSYGGLMIYTPGDYVSSSSALLAANAPDLRFDKLGLVMYGYKIACDDLRRTVEAFVGRRAHVLGDSIVDSYTRCSMIGGQTKTPTISVKYEECVNYIGGAAVVAKHMKAAGASVVFSTVLGDDKIGEEVLDSCEAFGIDLLPCIDSLRPTTNKNAIVVDGYRLLKIDTLDNRTISDQTLNYLRENVEKTKTDVLVFSDFRHGIFNKRTIPVLVDAIQSGIFKVADSQVASRWGNITEFKGFDLITPNEREARFSLGDQDSGVRPLASTLYDEAQCKTLMLKLGEKGMIVCTSPIHEGADSFFVIDSMAKNVVDPVGAGDALLAYASLALQLTGNPAIAAILGTVAAGIECERDGNIPVSSESVMERIDEIETALV